jgi:hypothetical protein
LRRELCGEAVNRDFVGKTVLFPFWFPNEHIECYS